MAATLGHYWGRAMQSGLVSIIVPCHNGARYVAQTLQSLQTQTHGNWQAWVVDDGSADNSASIIKQFSVADPRIQLLQQPRNMGVVAARNRGLAAAQGQYVAFCDADDVWLPQKLEAQLAFMQQHKAAFCYTQFRRISANGQKVGVLQQPPATLTHAKLLNGNPVCLSTVVLDRTLCRDVQFNCPYPVVEDYCLWLDLTAQGFVGQCAPIDGTRYRVHGASVSANKAHAALQFFKVLAFRQKLPMALVIKNFISYAKNAVAKRMEF